MSERLIDVGLAALTAPGPARPPWAAMAAGAVGVLGLAMASTSAMTRAIAAVRTLPKFNAREYGDATEPEFDNDTIKAFVDSLPAEQQEGFLDDIHRDQDPHRRRPRRGILLPRRRWDQEQKQLFAEWLAHTDCPAAGLYELQYHKEPFMNRHVEGDPRGRQVHIDVYNKDLKIDHLGDDAAPLARAMLEAYGYDAGKIVPNRMPLEKQNEQRVARVPKRPHPHARTPQQRRRSLDAPSVSLLLRRPQQFAFATAPAHYDTACATAALTARAAKGQTLPRKSPAARGQCTLSEVYGVKGGARVAMDEHGLEVAEDAYDSPSVES